MLDELKEYLRVTWSDESTDRVLSGILERGKALLNGYATQVIDYDEKPEHKQLLFDCCRYLYNNAFEEFAVNFLSELVMLRAEYKTAEVVNDEAEQG